MSDCLETACLFEKDVDQTVFFTLSQSFCGLEAAVSLLDFCKTYDRQVTWEEVVNEGKIEATKDFDINAHAALVEKIEASEVLADDMSVVQLDNLGEYFKTLPAEIAMKLWSAVGKNAGEKKNNIVNFHARVKDTLIPMLGTTQS